jgi:hypothetical protein
MPLFPPYPKRRSLRFFILMMFACAHGGLHAEDRPFCPEEPDKMKEYACARQNALASERELEAIEATVVKRIKTDPWIGKRSEFMENYEAQKLAFEKYRLAFCHFEAWFFYYEIEPLPAKIQEQYCQVRINDDREKILLNFHSVPVM